jgi:lipopolysaccharide transport system permease protein
MNAGLIQQIYVPKYLFPLIQILGNSFKFLIVLVMLLIFLLIIGKTPSWSWLALVPVVLSQLMLITAIGFLLAAIIPFAQDLKQVVDNVLMLMMFMSGIFFSADRVPESMRFAFELNPMVLLIAAYRDILLYGFWPNWGKLGYVWLVAFPVILLAIAIFRRFERHYPKLML